MRRSPQVVDLRCQGKRATWHGTGYSGDHDVPRRATRRRLQNERTRPGPEAGAARLSEEPRLCGDRGAHSRTGQRRQHGDLHPPRPGHAASAARRATRPPGRALRSRPVLGLVGGEQRHGDPGVAPDVPGVARQDAGLRRSPGARAGIGPPDAQGHDRESERGPGLGRLLPGARPARGARPALHARRRSRAVRTSRRRAGARPLRAQLRRRPLGRRPHGQRQQPPDDDSRRGTPGLQRRGRGLGRRHLRPARHAAGAAAHLGQAARRLALALAHADGPPRGRRLPVGSVGRGEPRLFAAPPGGLGAHPGWIGHLQDAVLQEDAHAPARRARHLGPARPVGHAAAGADGDGRPGAADRVRQRGEPAADARNLAAQGNRGAAGARRGPAAPGATAPRGEPRALAGGRARGPADRVLGGGGAHPGLAVQRRDPHVVGRAGLAGRPLHSRALGDLRCGLRARAGAPREPGRPRAGAQERGDVRGRRDLPAPQGARDRAGGAVAAAADRGWPLPRAA